VSNLDDLVRGDEVRDMHRSPSIARLVNDHVGMQSGRKDKKTVEKSGNVHLEKDKMGVFCEGWH
jgi:hypothetical protein